jgi:hypothetical protein
MHLQRIAKYGDPHFVIRTVGTMTPERFWSLVAVTANPEKCWEWTRSIGDRGYGSVRVKKKTWHTHRLAWSLANGRMPTLYILHSCDNKRCCNPNHLREGTQLENVREAIERGLFKPGERKKKLCVPHTLR